MSAPGYPRPAATLVPQRARRVATWAANSLTNLAGYRQGNADVAESAGDQHRAARR
ncbi:MAG TPA: hypothetical protein VJT49_26995 [Amycolatopsis sp.]|uniref:hypothetical protein n=1 Tax=Amycolatopsis sp. TaxID=37632 RepID=UPI002B483A58|nr:hypothetical protein [Amycolatopsis sp.]HKS48689.1 hypothetical protein [Amycolatopsis sp.]